MTIVSGAVASGHPAATAAALDLLRAGASAVDAAIAADAVMGVVEPIATGIGGDVMAIVAKLASTEAYNGAGRTGRSMTLADVVSSDHGYVPSLGGAAVTVPGAVRGWWDLHQRHGRVPWAGLFEAAIDAATDGVAVGAVAARTCAAQSSRLDEAGRHLYLRDGDAPQAGSTWRNPDLATLLAVIATDGPSAFYDSDVATAIARAVNSAGGRIDATDIAGHQGQWVSPHITFVDGMTIVTVPPPCQGMVVGLAARLLAEDGRLGDLSPKGHLCLLESLDRAFSVAADEVYDRSPESVPEVDRLVAMARERRLGGPVPYGPGTVFTAVADAETMVALVSSVCDRFGSGVTVPGHGFVLGQSGTRVLLGSFASERGGTGQTPLPLDRADRDLPRQPPLAVDGSGRRHHAAAGAAPDPDQSAGWRDDRRGHLRSPNTPPRKWCGGRRGCDRPRHSQQPGISVRADRIDRRRLRRRTSRAAK